MFEDEPNPFNPDPNLSLTQGSAPQVDTGFWRSFMAGLPHAGSAGLEGIESALSGYYKPDNAVGVNDAGQWTDADGNPIAPTRRPTILPVTKAPPSGIMDPMSAGIGGGLEGAMPSILDVANTMGNPFAPAKGMTLGAGITRSAQAPEKTAPAFYSAVEKSVESLPQAKAQPEQWLATLRNQPGVKPEEIDWLGLPDFMKDKKSITKQELQDYIRDNRVELKEVTKGVEPEIVEKAKAIATEQGWNWDDVSQSDRRKYFAKAAGRKLTDYPVSEPKFASYQMPGGENYREMLLTLPPKETGFYGQTMHSIAKKLGYSGWHSSLTPEQKAHVERVFDAQEVKPMEVNSLLAKINDDMDEMARDRDPVTNVMRRESEWHNLARERDSILEKINNDSGGGFKSSHWDEPNVLAHIRVNDRMINGGKSLNAEEFQSDWLQKGRKSGFKASESEKNRLTKELQDIQSERSRLVASSDPAERQRYQELEIQEGLLTDEYNRVVHDGVPNAPFKNTWHELLLKRLVREAAEKGYDSISWTPGKVQADRYDLSNQIDSIAYRKDGEGTWEISAIKDGNSVITKYGQTPSQLEEVIGKDVAKKIVGDEGKVADDFRGKNGGAKELSGLDLKVGGEGMIGFYDKMLPAAANKMFKKYGAKVETAEVGIGGGKPAQHADFDAWQKAQTKKQPVHYMKITPELRKAALGQGFPMFSKATTPTAAGSENERGYKYGGAVTEAQKKAGNYKKKHISFQGMSIAIENRKGSVRRGKDKNGKRWSCKMPQDYGYLKRTEGSDGDAVDCYVGPDNESDKVFIIDQQDEKTKRFDEHKCMLGFPSLNAALACYQAAFSDGKALDRIAQIIEMGVEQFKDWLKDGDTTKPSVKEVKGYAFGGAVDGHSFAGALENPVAFPVGGNIQDLIREAGVKAGIDPAYLLAKAQIESRFNPNARNAGSGASGLFQFIPSTWGQYAKGKDPFDPAQNTDAMVRFTKDNVTGFEKAMGRKPTPGEMYLMHQQGLGGALSLLRNPDAKATALLPPQNILQNLPKGANPNLTAREFASLWGDQIGRGMKSFAQPETSIPDRATLASAKPSGMFDDIPAAQPNQIQPTREAPPVVDFETKPSGMFDDIKPSPKDVGQGTAAVEGALAGVSAHLRDEIYGLSEASGLPKVLGGFRAPVGAGALALEKGVNFLTGSKDDRISKSYEKARDEKRAIVKEAESQYPKTFLAGNVAGAVALPAGKVLQAATLPQRMIQGAKVGAGYGGLSGFGQGEGLEDSAKEGIKGAGIGAGVGLAAPLVLKGVESGVKKARDLAAPIVSPFRAMRDQEGEAARRVAQALEMDKSSKTGLGAAEFNAAKASGAPVGLIDLGGETTRGLARASANVSPEARNILTDFIENRFTTQTNRLSDAVKGSVQTPADSFVTREALKGAKSQASPYWKKAMQDGARGIMDADLAAMAESPAMGKAIKEAGAAIRNQVASGRSVNPVAKGPNGESLPTLEFWHQVKVKLDDQYRVLKRAGEDSAAADVSIMKQSLVQKLDDATRDANGVSSYQTARGVSSEIFKATDALDAGEKFAGSLMGGQMKMTPAEFNKVWGKMHSEERDLFKEGVASSLNQKLSSSAERRDATNRLFDNEQARKNMETIFGPVKAKELEAAKRLENVMDFTRKAMGNSTTTRQLIERKMAEHGPQALAAGAYGATQGSPNPFSWSLTDPTSLLVGALTYWGANKRANINSQMANRVVTMLTSNDPAILQKGIALVAKNQQFMSGIRKLDNALARVGSGKATSASQGVRPATAEEQE